MKNVISFINFKGGVGKTTSTISIAGELSSRGYKVLIVDLDPSGNLSSAVGRKGDNKEMDHTSKLLKGVENPSDLVLSTDIENLFIIPTCSGNLTRTMREIQSESFRRTDIRLKKGLEPLQDTFDYILVDCGPSDNILNLNAMTASDNLIVPMRLEKYSLEGFDFLQEMVFAIKEETNPELKILGIVETMYKTRSALYKELHESIQNSQFGNLLFNTIIRQNSKMEESPFAELPVCLYDKKSNGAIDYKDLTDEILERMSK